MNPVGYKFKKASSKVWNDPSRNMLNTSSKIWNDPSRRILKDTDKDGSPDFVDRQPKRKNKFDNVGRIIR